MALVISTPLRQLGAGLLLTTLSLGSWAASSLEASLNNDTFQVEYDTNLPSTANLFVNASVMYTEEYEHDSALVGTLGIQGVETDNSTYRAAIGARLYVYDFGSLQGSALSFGGLFYHVFPGMQRLSAGGYAWYAPQVTSFGNTEQMYEFGARLAYRVIQNTDIFAGYRHLNLKHERGFNDQLEKGVNVGFRLNF